MTTALRTALGLPDQEETGWPEKMPDHFSYSMGGMYERCREQFRLHYIHGWKSPPKGFLLWGTADSKAAQLNFSQKIQTETDLPVKEVEEAFVGALETQLEKEQNESGLEAEWDKGSLDDTRERGRLLAAAYHRVVAPKVRPIKSEEKFQLVIPELPVPIEGYIDVETKGSVIERKTSGSKWTVPPGNYEAQARVYQLSTLKPVHFHVSVKTKTPGLYTPEDASTLELPFTHTSLVEAKRWITSTVEAMLNDLKAYGPDRPWPGARGRRDAPCGWLCGFKDRCYWWTGKAP